MKLFSFKLTKDTKMQNVAGVKRVILNLETCFSNLAPLQFALSSIRMLSSSFHADYPTTNSVIY